MPTYDFENPSYPRSVVALRSPAYRLWPSRSPTQSTPESPYGGTTVEEIVARVNDQIITKSDYDRAQAELDQEMRQRGATMQEISDSHKDLLRNLIDQQLWLAKGKELGITGETELVNRAQRDPQTVQPGHHGGPGEGGEGAGGLV